ncbi:type III polyketide synthase [Roseomonas sp. CCTCC AB2023176]|uniref:type III polyketide synthase n=1 Tax=Roseomonas sp. CCTCC AB2023176 TaxID=3342640 RepID=UPI0035DAB06E
MAEAHLNRIATATPRHEVHDTFRRFAGYQITEPKIHTAFARLAERSQVNTRWSVLEPLPDATGTADGFYRLDRFPRTGERMARYEREAPALAGMALDRLAFDGSEVTHLILATCTGFAAPGLDHWIIREYGLPNDVERTIVGFMGCQAAINALKLARHAVRSDPRARVLVVNLELCSLHLQPSSEVEQLLCFLLFADGCSAALVTAEEEGFRMDGFHAALFPDASDQITWHIGDAGFDMTLAGTVPLTLARALPDHTRAILGGANHGDIDLWAVHPGGRSILDAVMHGLDIPPEGLDTSRTVLRDNGNMSSATVMFVLEQMLARSEAGQRGVALAFGPGLSAETMRFTAC